MNYYLRLLREYVLSVFDILLVDDHKAKRITFLTTAYLDGLKGNFDNNKPKKILYG
jgi:rhamnopyranosyl-N-acetylglucosaminyl-diphospho-decaprenol beta-1,3/1,4-galactofuranosyltransferase